MDYHIVGNIQGRKFSWFVSHPLNKILGRPHPPMWHSATVFKFPVLSVLWASIIIFRYSAHMLISWAVLLPMHVCTCIYMCKSNRLYSEPIIADHLTAASRAVLPYPRKREPTTKCRPTSHFGLNFLLRSSVYNWLVYEDRTSVISVSILLNGRKTKPS